MVKNHDVSFSNKLIKIAINPWYKQNNTLQAVPLQENNPIFFITFQISYLYFPIATLPIFCYSFVKRCNQMHNCNSLNKFLTNHFCNPIIYISTGYSYFLILQLKGIVHYHGCGTFPLPLIRNLCCATWIHVHKYDCVIGMYCLSLGYLHTPAPWVSFACYSLLINQNYLNKRFVSPCNLIPQFRLRLIIRMMYQAPRNNQPN